MSMDRGGQGRGRGHQPIKARDMILSLFSQHFQAGARLRKKAEKSWGQSAS
jgi:hypothetical protein